MSQEYLLNRGSDESSRLVGQHKLYSKMLGYLIKPSIASALPKNPKIADVGTGTGAWAIDAAKQWPSSQVAGFDISDAQFLPQNSLPINVTLKVHDLRQPFPVEMRGRFDVVFLRLLTLALPTAEAWVEGAKNVAALLKPGGWLQWVECDWDFLNRAVRKHSWSRITALRDGMQRMHNIIGEVMFHVPAKLTRAFEAAGLVDLDMDAVSNERIPELRTAMMQVGIGALEGMQKQYRSVPALAQRLPGTREDDERLIGAMRADAATGGYVIWYINCLSGRKPHKPYTVSASL